MQRLSFIFFLAIIGLNGCAQQSAKKVAIFDVTTPSKRPHTILGNKKPSPAQTHKEKIRVVVRKQQTPLPSTPDLIPKKSPDNLWERMLSLYTLDPIENKRVQKQIAFYLKHPSYLTKIQKRAAPYLHFILDEIQAKGIPGEMALLPVVESAFLPEAYSRSHAAGIWQFIPSTGRFFGLKQNWWYDGRRDIYASTKAATRYLKELSEEFNGDWHLALASYNAGKGNIRKARRKNARVNKPTDYWSLKLRKETMDYVPRLLAVAHIFANAKKYQLELLDLPNKPYFAKVNIGSQIDLETAANMANMSQQEFKMLNPGFNRWLSDPDGPHYLLIPADQKHKFNFKLAKLPESKRLNIAHYRIKKGDSLSMIAKRHSTSIHAIKRMNRLSSNKIRTGKSLLIPIRADSKQFTKAQRKPPSERIYTVKRGDNFWRIARRFSVRSKDIARWNKLSLSSLLKPGQKLIIKKA